MALVVHPPAYAPWQVLRDICHAFGSASHLDEAASSAGRWVQAALGTQSAACRIALPDAAGRLRVVWGDGDAVDGPGRKRSSRRRAAFHTKAAVRVDLPHSNDQVLLLLPLVCRGTPVGVLEVAAPRRAVEERWETLEAVASQVAIALWNVTERARLRRQGETLGRTTGLGRDLARASSPEAALRVAVRFIFDRFQIPLGAWAAQGDSDDLTLIEMRGLGPGTRRKLRAEMATLPRWGSLSASERAGVLRRFRGLLRLEEVQVLDAGEAVLFAAHVTPSLRVSLDVVESLLGEVVRRLTASAEAERRKEQFDLGIAWTAHEFRGPLLAVRAVLEFLLRGGEGSPADRAMVRRSLRELEQLAGHVDGVLRWAAGTAPLRRRQTDLVRVVVEAVESCRLETGEDRVSVAATPRIMASIDAAHLRGAVANLIRNALMYSPPPSPVLVSVEESPGWAVVAVKDEGPGISPSEQDSIFGPFVRGGTARLAPNGKGIGLFIARRVVEAHNGTISLESGLNGATFQIRLPLGDGRP